ncbi:ATPase, partial [Lactobacillus salivarius]|nr:ATPase [Ligilactobacillus salivarius]
MNSEVDYFISVISLFLGIIFDYVFFYLISPIKKNIKKDSIFICTTFPLVFIFSGAGDRMAFYTELVEVALFYFVYKRRIIDYGILGRLLLIQSYSYITYGVENLFFQLIGKQDTSINSMICGFIFVLIEYILFTKTTVVENLDNEYGKVYFFLILYLYFGSIAVYYLANYVIKIDILAYTIAIIIIIGQLIFSLYIYNNSKKIRQDKLNLQQIKDLKTYTQQLESSQRSLRKFKHDYQNMLLSLKLSAKKSHDKELIDKLAEYSSKILEDKVLWQFNDVDNVKDEL